jgi:hypothetical protein
MVVVVRYFYRMGVKFEERMCEYNQLIEVCPASLMKLPYKEQQHLTWNLGVG